MIDFTVIGPDGKPKMSTKCEKCIPPREQLDHMRNAGYTFLMNGKLWRPGGRIRENREKRITE